jgi:uncharacterized membrane protein
LPPQNKGIPKLARGGLPRTAPIYILPESMRPPMPRENRSKTASPEKFPARVHQVSTCLFGAALALALVNIFQPMDSAWPTAWLILLATLSTLAALTRQLPLQNVLLAASGIALVGGAASAIGARTGIPFGPFTFGSVAGPQFFKILPWAMPPVWVVVVLNSRGVARLILRPWRKTRTYGYWLAGLAATLTMLLDFALDPFASRLKHYWIWAPTKFPVTWQDAPLVNFFAWGIVSLLMLVLVSPALINKQLSKHNAPRFHPLAVWLGAILLFGTASARHGLWSMVAVDGVIGIVTAVFAIRGARW